MSQEDQIYKWLDDSEASTWKCAHIKTVISLLEKSGNKVQKIGLANYRSPEAFLFLERPIEISVIEHLIEKSNNLSFRSNELASVQVLACEKDYVTLIYEPK